MYGNLAWLHIKYSSVLPVILRISSNRVSFWGALKRQKQRWLRVCCGAASGGEKERKMRIWKSDDKWDPHAGARGEGE
jgi:hypothetical protein